MWKEEDFEADLEKIKSKHFESLAISKCEQPKDAFLCFRHQLISLMSLFEQNMVTNQKEYANILVPTLVKFLIEFDKSFLTEQKDSPPFDLFLLGFMVSSSSTPNYSLLIRLFHHYTNVLAMIDECGDTVYLNDMSRRSEITKSKEDAKATVRARINYLAEIVTSLLYSVGQHRLLQTFIADFCPPGFTTNEETLSQLGRMSLACGDMQMAVQFFNEVTDPKLKSANQGYMDFFGGSFQAAKEDFANAKEKAPTNIEACSKHMGHFTHDPNETPMQGKRQTAEEKSQWPAQPKY